MNSRYEQILSTHHENLPNQWQEFATRSESSYSSDLQSRKAMAYGYKAAADIVAKECCDKSSFRDVLYSPIFFLFRHFIELYLKAILHEFSSRNLIDCEKKLKKHVLLPYWTEVKKVCSELGIISENDGLIENVEKSIRLFSDIDNRSMHSRYLETDDVFHSIIIDIDQLVIATDDIDTVFSFISFSLCNISSEQV